MTDEPKEAIPEPAPPQSVSKTVGIMVDAFKLSKTATGYTEGNSEVPGNILSGSAAQPNPTLSRFIKISEKAVIKEMQDVIIDRAGRLIGIELDAIRGLLG